MATIITHAIVAGALATAAPSTLPRDLVPRGRLALLLAVLAMIPDLDVIGFRYGIAYSDMLGHRGFTHSIPFAALAAVLAPAVFRRLRVGSRGWWLVASMCFVATISHGVLDAFTDAGLGVGFLIPFDDARFFAPWRPLATSPLSVSAFLTGPALRILANEAVFVGLPLLALLTLRGFVRWARRR